MDKQEEAPQPAAKTDDSTGEDVTDRSLMYRSISRGHWGSRMEFLLSCLGLSVGLGNVWRFPYLCYKNGGAAFLFAYMLLQLFVGKPLYFMELAMSQYAAKGPVRVWDMNPAARGVGFSMCFFSLQISFYYNVIMTYVLYFFIASFVSPLPWTECDPSWGETCFNLMADYPHKCVMPAAGVILNASIRCICSDNLTIDSLFQNCYPKVFAPTELYFQKTVTKESPAMEMGPPSWRLALLLLLSWAIVLGCMIKGIRSTGKVVYFTATSPYVVLVILLIRGITLDGAGDGIYAYLVPDWQKLLNSQLWLDAAGQLFFSLAVCLGGILMFGSYNNFHNHVYGDAALVSTLDMLTSFMSGFVIFSTFGYMAKKTSKDITEVASNGFGLAFQTYPEVLATLPWANVWAVLFFFMLYVLGLDSQFALLETVTTYLIDDFAVLRRNTVKLRTGFAVVLYLLGLLLVCPIGPVLVNIIDTYGITYAITCCSAIETISVMWVYGIKRFMGDLEYMLGRKPPLLCYWYFVWVFVDPLVLATMFILSIYKSQTPTYLDGTSYTTGTMFSCWFLLSVVLSPIPGWFFLHVAAIRRRHRFTDFAGFVKKVFEPGPRFGPADGLHPEATRRGQSVFSDVLDWERVHPKERSDVDADVPPPDDTRVLYLSPETEMPPNEEENGASQDSEVDPMRGQ